MAPRPAHDAPSAVTGAPADDWRSVVAGFLAEKLVRAEAAGTASTYARIIARFLSAHQDPGRVNPLDVHRFAYGLGKGVGHPPPAPSTISVRLAAVSGLYDFATRMGYVSANPADKVRRPKSRPATPRGLSAHDVERLLASIPEDRRGLFDRALIVTAVLTGLRRTELTQMVVMDLLQAGEARYEVRVKGGVPRRRTLPEPARLAIVRALTIAGREPADEPTRVFPVSAGTFHAHLARHARAAGLGTVAPHDLRHTAAKLRRERGASLEQVSWLLGHRSIATTARYLARLEDECDDGWHGVASAIDPRMGLGALADRDAIREVASQPRSRSIDVRQGDRCIGRPVIWEGAHVHARPPGRDRSLDGGLGPPSPRTMPGRRRRHPSHQRGSRGTGGLSSLWREAPPLDGR